LNALIDSMIKYILTSR